ncbi:SLC13 family permease [Desulfobacter postgatei]|uniref:Di-/tricarboxylate transporter n=1 Tax=Desulfobacter postgatei 2ac9 TaxID=879212 RepID=I5AZG9_9BACT|nr:SLC13 family permease [Desulfobacter postgatei]EIM62632.1 di-/tricarboxylate transporter [Desulfobacter postgatei 2ac9]
MDIHAWIAVATLVAAMVLFISKLIPLEATALSIPVVLALTGTVNPAEAALRGFGNSAVISLGAIFVLSAGLKESGVATLMGRMLERFGGKKEWRLVLLIMVTTCVLSAIMSNAATVAVFLPAVLVLSRRANISPSRLMMPLGYAAILGGTLTLISTTSNLILGSELDRLSGGDKALGMFEFAVLGVPISVAGIAYMVLIGTRLIGKNRLDNTPRVGSFQERLKKRYNPEKKLFKLTIPSGSDLADATIEKASLGKRFQIEVVQIARKKGFRKQFIDIRPDLKMHAGDVLFVDGRDEDAQRLAKVHSISIEIATEVELESLRGRGINMAEVLISPHSAFLDRTLIDISFRNVFGLSVLAILRSGKIIEKDVGATPLKLGDALLVYGPVRYFRKLEENNDLVLLDRQQSEEDVRHAPIALVLLAVALLPPVLGLFPLAVSALASALLMVATGCVSLRGAQKAIDFRILFLIIGTIPLGDALFQTGVAGKMAANLFPAQMSLGPFYVLGVLFVVSSLFSTASNNAAAAVILAPVAYPAAEASGIDVSKTFLAVAYGASCAFVLPFAHQCNLMTMGPGGYKTKDFIKVGVGLSLVMATTAVVLLAL